MKKALYALALLNAALITALFGRLFNNPDTRCYVSGARLLFGLPKGEACDYRILKPLALLFPGMLEKTTGIEAQYGFFMQNLVFYFLSSFLVFELIKLVFKNELEAFWGSLLFITAPPVLFYGLAYMTDMPGWFFVISGVIATLRVFEKLTERPIYALFVGLIPGVGFLWKESAIAGVVFLGSYVLTGDLPTKQKRVILLYGAVGFLAPVLLSSVILYNHFHYTFWGWYSFIKLKPYGDDYHLFRFMEEAVRTLSIGWILCLLGLFRFLSDYFQGRTNPNELRFLIASGATLLLWPIWPYPSNRVFYLSGPFLVAVGGYGAGLFSKTRGGLLVLFAALSSFTISALWAAFHLRGVTYVFVLMYLTIIIWWLPSKLSFRRASP
jgi:hypothetical protein